LPAAAETRAVTQPAKTKPAPRKRPPAKPRARAATPVPPAPPAPAAERPHGHLRALAVLAFVLAAAIVVAVLLLRENAPEPAPQSASAVSAAQLASRAEELGLPIYWAGNLPGRTLELTSSKTGAFVRYLPAGEPVGGEDRTLTVATYPMADAYATAVRRAKATGMRSTRTQNGGLAVWSTTQPTSVYVAWPGVESLVEVYAPSAATARATAVSGRVRPAG
jgi:hypothetical protein